MKRRFKLIVPVLLLAFTAQGCHSGEQSPTTKKKAHSTARQEAAKPGVPAEDEEASPAPAAASAAANATSAPDGEGYRESGRPHAGLQAPQSPTPKQGANKSDPADRGGDKAGGREGEGQVAGNQPREPQVSQEQYFHHYGTNPTIDTAEQPKSTFSIDVDNASYTLARSYLDKGQLPPEAAVRVEELVNSFDYGYQAPVEDTFAVFAEAAPSPNRHGYQVLHIGIKGKEVDAAARQPTHLTFVIDISGSMEADNRLGLVKKSLHLLVNELREDDTVAIVVFGDQAREALAPTSGVNKQVIARVIDSLRSEGSTNAEAGLRMGYQVAEKLLEKRGVHRVVLCSDGVANVGMTGPNGILETVHKQVDRGITLTTIGVGMGDYNDTLMEQLAQHANGNYYYLDKLDAAKKVFVERLTGTMQVIAKDVKVQVEFDPKMVARYRLIGYENRALKTRDFDNDSVDAGEVGAGHVVTAIYEVKLTDAAAGDLAKIRLRFKAPQGEVSKLVEKAVPRSVVHGSLDELSSPGQLALAAAELGEKLRGSYWARNLGYDDILARFKLIRGSLGDRADVTELRRLVETAKRLDKRPDKFAQHGPVAQMDFDQVPVLR